MVLCPIADYCISFTTSQVASETAENHFNFSVAAEKQILAMSDTPVIFMSPDDVSDLTSDRILSPHLVPFRLRGT